MAVVEAAKVVVGRAVQERKGTAGVVVVGMVLLPEEAVAA